MKYKKIGLFLLLTFSAIALKSQAFYGDVDQKVQFGASLYGYGNGFSGSYDKGLSDYFSLGFGADLYLNETNNKDTNFYLFGRFNGHLGGFLKLPLELDVYPGATLGITGDRLGYGLFGGIRYFFTESLGLYAELGNQGRVGLSFSF